jgi:hypothetical protein
MSHVDSQERALENQHKQIHLHSTLHRSPIIPINTINTRIICTRNFSLFLGYS